MLKDILPSIGEKSKEPAQLPSILINVSWRLPAGRNRLQLGISWLQVNWWHPHRNLICWTKSTNAVYSGWVWVIWRRRRCWRIMRVWPLCWGRPSCCSRSLEGWSLWLIILTQGNLIPVYSLMILFVHFRQESLLALVDAQRHVDLIHSMSYDQGGAQHSPRYIPANMLRRGRVMSYFIGSWQRRQ